MNFDYFYRNKHQLKILELYFSNLPHRVHSSLTQINEAKIFQALNRWASIKDIRLFKKSREDSSFAYVEFYRFDEMMTVLKKLYGWKIEGRNITVEISQNAVVCCRCCFIFGHLAEDCPLKKPRLVNVSPKKTPQNYRDHHSREKRYLFERNQKNFETHQEKRVSNLRSSNRASQYEQSRRSPRLCENKNQGARSKNISVKHDDYKKIKAKSNCFLYDDNSLAETTYEQDQDERNLRNVCSLESLKKNWKDQRSSSEQKSEESLQFVEIVKSKGEEARLISVKEELKLRRLEKEGFFETKCKMGRRFVRIVRQNMIEY